MCNWINIKWNECCLVIVMNDLENTSISMVAQWSMQLSGGSDSGSSGGGVSGGGWSPVARVVVLSFFCFFLLSHV